MSDLSLPPLSLVPMGADAAPPLPTLPPVGQGGQRPGAGPLAWPAPPSIGYAAPPPLAEPEPCELEGPNGRVNVGRLLSFERTGDTTFEVSVGEPVPSGAMTIYPGTAP